jgi:hypothetical protein
MDDSGVPKKNDLQSEIDAQLGSQTPPVTPPTPPTPTPTPNPPVKTPNNVPQKPVVPQNPKPKPIPPPQRSIIPQHPQPKPAPPPKKPPRPSTPADSVNLSTVRTYTEDVQGAVTGDKISSAKILIAEQKRKEKKEQGPDKNDITAPKNQFKLGFSVILIGIAVIAVLYASFIFFMPKPQEENGLFTFDEVQFFVIDGQQSIDTTDRLRSDILNDLQSFFNSSFKEKTINEVIFYSTYYEGPEKKAQKLSSQTLISLFDWEPPVIFSRNLPNDYVLGTHTLDGINREFLIFKIDDFGSLYDSIFDYEKNIVYDLRKIFGGFNEFEQLEGLKAQRAKIITATSTATTTKEVTEVDETATSTATSTPPVPSLEDEIMVLQDKVNSYRRFFDMVIQNSDSRVIRGENSEVLFYYTFIDREWLLFSDDTEVLKEIKRRIREKSMVR